MVLTVVCGGFFGDEGKGKIAGYLAIKDRPEIAVRTGSVNAGHTAVYRGQRYKFRLLPVAALNNYSRLLLPSGCLIRLDVLFRELELFSAHKRLGIDLQAGIIEERHIEMERCDSVMKGIGSTMQGVGAATAERVMRRLKVAREVEILKPYLTDVAKEVNEAIDKGLGVLIEGTQGLYLSLYHGTYPYVTSRDTSASAILSEVGVGPKKVDEIIVVLKAYVTRVGSGPLPNEMPEEEAAKRGLLEVATVTGRKRRVAPFNIELAKRAVMINSATQVAITKVDVLFKDARGKRRWEDLPSEARKWIENIENELKTPVTLIGTGEELDEIIDLRNDKLGPQ